LVDHRTASSRLLALVEKVRPRYAMIEAISFLRELGTRKTKFEPFS
jgi:hypothetical protein